MIGVKKPATPVSALSSTGISMNRPRTLLGLPGRQLERDVGAERGPADDRRLETEVVDQFRDLTGEERHRVEPQVLGAIGAPVAEQVDADHPVAALGQRRPQAREHLAVHQQAVGEDDDAVTLPVGVVPDPVAVVAELGHRVRLLGRPAGQSSAAPMMKSDFEESENFTQQCSGATPATSTSAA